MNQRVSVCMATYNGASFVSAQIESILAQLVDDDELVIVDDASTDDTVAVVESIGDPRIRIIRQNVNQGYVRTFERALREATGDVLLLSDQDDLWLPGRRDLLAQAALSRGVAASNLVLLGSDHALRSPLTGRPWLLKAADSRRRWRNELLILAGDIPYFGCAMAMSRDAVSRVLPFPPYLSESHDLWIATVANRHGLMTHVDAATLRRRVHAGNASTPRPRSLRHVLAARWMLVRAFASARRR
ncbi:glycosyltransferase [Microbacterium lacticum]|uniref:Glycosyl transferase family 2 n=1 Tax=Microbacterium lacticum TaxID=33885 RepID=A0A4Y3UJT5_9MICO|nr:glycosyltransferase [Microbacterium lacticum]TQM98986.1 glycosyl transferase family 2 [Microbacterium lacticum]GEB94956.1 alpha-L-Rha alpha-1,3-L-rhamnosyltransferase [Microbacterium lacticum]GGN13176.1 alpha-L-Rha alpha-1,3-L-rhamnosyltransferase [Microbacterium lacticum]